MTEPRTRQGARKEGPGQTWEVLLTEILTNRPRLAGAACAGSPELFDPAEPDEHPDSVGYRHLAAQKTCLYACPVLDECRAWAETEKGRGRVLAGLIPRSTRLTPREDVA
ncbi:WhiB family transcriptional regulator [Rhodococcus sp. H29-C3]|uniref:WhiB family transcriptional regulator n=1 Tax=Rhodococcus sp. H29-C3 TaxID=3046307 RepID=UPI0024BB16B5|nr:WhiB family transcriptional regulator [Rhodococcus sp. H29-C3]MDJ0359703.1 WhiB family transcriptional regulator [Rhodococcus sp. H29-C3]